MTLADAYEAFLLDLDGVLFRGEQPIPAAGPTVDALRAAGKRLVFLTNNSARTPEQVVAKLEALSIPAGPEEVLTSAQATAEMLRREGDGRPRTAFVIGEEGIRRALTDAGYELVDGDDGRAGTVVVGWDRGVTYESLRRAAVLVQHGARLVATNADASYPAPGGELWPGAGAILAAIQTASGREATVVGKPHRPLFDAALAAAGTDRALMVGDRVETDIAGAAAAGLDACLVLSGAGRPADLLDQGAIPVAIAPDVGGILDRSPARARPAEEADLAAVRALAETATDSPDRGPEGVWVIEDREPLATATVEVADDDAYLRAVATTPALRGRGLGTLAVAAAVREARARGAGRVWLLTETAEGFFAGLGFEPVERAGIPSWIEHGPAASCAGDAVAMRRDVPQ